MDRPYWQRQNPSEPLFADLLWSRPETRVHAGKLLIVGGHAHGFAAPAEAYAAAQKAGVGTARVLLPISLQKNVSRLFPEAEYAPATPSGSFAQQALGELLPMAHWADGILFAGDLGRNSETAILIESFLHKHPGQITLTNDAVDYAITQPGLVADRENTLLVLGFSQLQKLASGLRFTTAFTSDMDMLRTVDGLHELTTQHPISIITKHLDTLIVATGGQVSTTGCNPDERVWRTKTAAGASVWWLQNPTKGFAALTTSLVE